MEEQGFVVVPQLVIGLVFVLFALYLLFSVAHLLCLYLISRRATEAIENAFDSMSKLAQIGMTFQKSKNVTEAVQQTVVLENELAALEAAKEALEIELAKPDQVSASKGKLTGFRMPNGRIVKFLAPPDGNLLSRIPKKDLIYEE